MAWHYMDRDEEVGPISKEELQKLVKQKKVSATTLVRGPGMAEFKALGDIVRRKPAAHQDPSPAPPPPRAPAPPPPRAPAPPESAAPSSTALSTLVCSECGRTFPEDDLIRFDTANICAACKPVFVQKMKEGMPVAGHYNYGGFWIRLGAKIIDWIILSVVIGILGVILAVFMVPASDSDASTGMLIVVQIVNFILPFVYGTWFIGRFAATPGKMACGLKIIRSEGEKVSYARALGRQAAELLSSIMLCIGYIMAAFNDEKKTLHDIICDTRVVKK